MAASFAGSGLNGLLPARGGDLVKLAFVHSRIDGARYSTLIATSVPETAFESLCGVALVVWMLVQGAPPVPSMPGELPRAASTCLSHWVIAALLALAALVVSFAVLRRVWRRCARFTLGGRRGLTIFSTPARFVAQVASWQALARVIRLGSIACFLAAFALPATFGTAVLVMAVQGGGRVLPLGPVNAGLRIAMLSYGHRRGHAASGGSRRDHGVLPRPERGDARRHVCDRRCPDSTRVRNALAAEGDTAGPQAPAGAAGRPRRSVWRWSLSDRTQRTERRLMPSRSSLPKFAFDTSLSVSFGRDAHAMPTDAGGKMP